VRRMARKVSASTKLKISQALRGNKNAFSGGSKRKLSTREKIANINAKAKAKKANLSSDQIARRQSVAKRLRAQARREEALGGGVPDVIKTNEQAKAEVRSDGALQRAGSVESVKRQAAQTAREANQRRQADRAKQVGTQASMPRGTKQNLNAPQKPAETRRVDLSPAQNRRRQRSKFEADQAKVRQAKLDELKNARDNAINAHERAIFDKAIARQSRADQDMRIRNAQTRQQAGEDAAMRANQRIAKATTQTDSRGNIVQRSGGKATTNDVLKAYEKKRNNDKPQPPQSDTGTDRSGTFEKKIPVKGSAANRQRNTALLATESGRDQLIGEFREAGGGDMIDAINFLATRKPKR
jgi:hypothetical protein